MPQQVATAVPSKPQSAGRSYRIESIDVLRGLLMVIMALDHTRDYFSNAAVNLNSIDPSVIPLVLFFITGFVVYLCNRPRKVVVYARARRLTPTRCEAVQRRVADPAIIIEIALKVLESTLIGGDVSSQTNALIHKQIEQANQQQTDAGDMLNLLTALVMGSPEFQLR